jgi:hypothetical protein
MTIYEIVDKHKITYDEQQNLFRFAAERLNKTKRPSSALTFLSNIYGVPTALDVLRIVTIDYKKLIAIKPRRR